MRWSKWLAIACGTTSLFVAAEHGVGWAVLPLGLALFFAGREGERYERDGRR